jgi:hypothetical protein
MGPKDKQMAILEKIIIFLRCKFFKFLAIKTLDPGTDPH